MSQPELKKKRKKKNPNDHSERARREYRKRSFREALFSGVLIFIISILVCVVIRYVRNETGEAPRFMFMTTGSIEHSRGTTALLVRDETLILAENDGDLIPLAYDGKRVSSDEEIAIVVPDHLKNVYNSVQDVRIQISQMQSELISQGKGAAAANIYASADQQFLTVINEIRSDVLRNRLDLLSAHTASLEAVMGNRNVDLQGIDFEDERLAELYASEANLSDQLEAGATSLFAPAPGIVSYKTDAQEEILKSEIVNTISSEELNEYLSSGKTYMQGQNDSNVAPLVRICKNNVQYFVMVIPGASLQDFPVNQDKTHTIRFQLLGITIDDCKVVRSEPTPEGVFLVFSTSSYVETLLDIRTAEVEVMIEKEIPAPEDGVARWKIPVSAFLNDQYKTADFGEILLNVDGYASIRRVHVVDQDREFALVEGIKGNELSEDSVLIVNPKSVREGEKVG